ncbi:MAG: undecaprenyldiphospho-muramoylpentapeptide beta-N-acetylglucosaminyltransferase [Bacteroidetes bacterium]|nr:MAG: undecaprenyldiphospho-muramoylpentapeptide beta-N-acetylglucosaminyltransferase [Bacteroidota bacterium]
MSRRIIISGGGTGGHIFPAISIANEICRREPDADVLFVGATGGMELTVVPRYQYKIEAVWISGIHRQLTLQNISRNLLFPLKLVVSLIQARRIVSRFRPQAVVGVGGFASGPLGRAAAGKGIPLFICEQNAFPGLVNRWLASRATRILLGNPDAVKFFDASKSVVTGNPIRSMQLPSREEAVAKLGLDPSRPVLLSLGGSLGALKINQALLAPLPALTASGVQLIWQCGKRYYETLRPQVPEHQDIKLMAFIEDMAVAYGAADLVISRAGGSTISELIALSLPSILVPSPNVAEDHQTKNARSLTDRGAALLVSDAEAIEKLIPAALDVLRSPAALDKLKDNILAVEKHDAAREIVDEIYKHL